MYKILRRNIYCNDLKGWLKTMAWVFFVVKVYPNVLGFDEEPFRRALVRVV